MRRDRLICSAVASVVLGGASMALAQFGTVAVDDSYWGNSVGFVDNYDADPPPPPFPTARNDMDGTLPGALMNGWINGTIPYNGLAMMPAGPGWSGNIQIVPNQSTLEFDLETSPGTVERIVLNFNSFRDIPDSVMIAAGPATVAPLGTDATPNVDRNSNIVFEFLYNPYNGNVGSPDNPVPRPLLLRVPLERDDPANPGTLIPLAGTVVGDVVFKTNGFFGENGRRYFVYPIRHGYDPFTVSYANLVDANANKYNIDADGDYNSGSSWRTNVPDGALEIAAFTDAITAPRTVTMSGPATVNSVIFDNANKYTVAGAGPLTLASIGASHRATIDLVTGDHEIAAPVVVAAPQLDITVPGGQALTLGGGLSGAGNVNKLQPGSLFVKNVRLDGALAIDGFVQIFPDGSDAGTSKVSELILGGAPGAWTSKFDLADNDLVVDYDAASPLATIRDMIVSGYAGGAGNGAGLTTFIPITNAFFGYAEASDVVALSEASGVFSGQTVDETSVVVNYTYLGDANLDGQVDVSDLGRIATGWQTSGNWFDGDFNYDGAIDVADLGILATNWQLGVGGPLAPGASFEAALASVGLSVVPEPGVATLALVSLLAARRRRA